MQGLFNARSLWLLSLLFIVYATSLPFDFSHPPSLARAELIPLWDPDTQELHSIPDMVQNVALFVPYGFLAVLVFAWLNRRSPLFNLAGAGLLGLSLSLAVEALQTLGDTRSPSATDLLTNTLGAAVGGLFGSLYRHHLAARVHQATARLARQQPGLFAPGLFLVGTFTALLAPFVPSLDVGLLRAKGRELLDHPLGTKALGSLPFDACLFGALAFGVTLEVLPVLSQRGWLRPRSKGGAAALAAMLTSMWALCLEVAQLPLVHHSPGARDALANVLGACIGAGVAVLLQGRSDPRPATTLGEWSRRWPAWVLSFVVAVPLFRALAPFRLASVEAALAKIDRHSFVPFWTLFSHLTMATFTNVLEAASTYVPLGWCLVALGRRPAMAFAWAAGLAVSLEVLQIPIEGRTFDPTEGLLAASGALVGAWLYDRLMTLAAEIK